MNEHILEQNIVDIDGYLVNEDGEIVGVAAPQHFAVVDDASAEWVLEKLQRENAEILALEARKKALIENFDTMIRTHKQRAERLLQRFQPELEHFARENLPKGKKTWTCPYGQISFRSVPEKIQVKDESLAVQWAKQSCPNAVKVKESFLVSEVDARVKAELIKSPDQAEANGLEVVPAYESVTIKTL